MKIERAGGIQAYCHHSAGGGKAKTADELLIADHILLHAAEMGRKSDSAAQSNSCLLLMKRSKKDTSL